MKSLLIIPLLSVASIGFAQDLRTSSLWGEEGHREYMTWSGSSSAMEGILRPDGKLLVAGTGYWSGCNCFRVTMALVDTTCGALDASFGNGGTTSFQFEGRSTLHDMFVQDDGKIVGCGITAPGNGFSSFKPAVYRLHANGMPDSTFNGSGYRKESFDPTSSGAFWQAFAHADGRITCVGSSSSNINGGTNAIGAMRFNADGTLDNSFSGDGKVTFAISSTGYTHDYDLGTGVMLPNGDVLAIGLFTAGGVQTIGMLKVDSTGTIVPGFGVNGLSISPVQAASNVDVGGMNAALTSSGKILVSGTSDFTNGTFFVARFLVDGNVDSTYATNGVSTLNIGNNALGRRLELLPDGSSLQFGSENWNNGIARVIKRTVDGTLDSTFGNNGVAAPSTPLFKKVFGGMSLPNGRMIAWGTGGEISVFKFVNVQAMEGIIDLGPDLFGCIGDSTTLDAGPGYMSYIWSTNDSTQMTAVQSTADVVLTVTDINECVDSDTVHVEFVAPPPQPIITIDNGVELTTTAAGDLQWFLNGVAIAGADQSTYIALSNGAYTVSTTDSTGCSSLSDPTQVTSVGIVPHGTFAVLHLYPNPATDMIRLEELNARRSVSLMAMDLTGRLIPLQMDLNGSIQIGHLSPGHYRLIAATAGQHFQVPFTKMR